VAADLPGSAYWRPNDSNDDLKPATDTVYVWTDNTYPYYDLIICKSECMAQCVAAPNTNAEPDADRLCGYPKIFNQNYGMEGPQNLKADPTAKSRQIILISIIILFHLVGIIGLAIPATRTIFLEIVPWHILLMLVVIIISHQSIDSRFLLFAIIIFIIGFCAEWIGVHKNWLFGSYNYGNTLGLKLDAVPLIIGINWFLLIYSSGVLMQRIRIRSMFIRIITGAMLLVLLDLLIEPIAIKFDYWHWSNAIIPLKNYTSWFLISCIMLFIFEKFNFKKQSIVAPILLLTQFLFFAVLNLL